MKVIIINVWVIHAGGYGSEIDFQMLVSATDLASGTQTLL